MKFGFVVKHLPWFCSETFSHSMQLWDSSPQDTVCAKNLHRFKRHVEEVIEEKSTKKTQLINTKAPLLLQENLNLYVFSPPPSHYILAPFCSCESPAVGSVSKKGTVLDGSLDSASAMVCTLQCKASFRLKVSCSSSTNTVFQCNYSYSSFPLA